MDLKKITTLLILGVTLSYCAVQKMVKETTPTDKELTAAQKRFPNATMEDLKEGHKIFYNECKECHKPFKIVGFSERKWLHEIDDMSPKAKLTDIQKEKLTKFVLSYRDANAPPKTEVAPVKQ